MMINNRVSGLPTRNSKDLVPFQGELKKIVPKDMLKLKRSILERGFIAPVFVWKNNILDGTHRLLALQELESEGHTIDGVPVVEIKADNKQQAAEMILAYNSQYAKITSDGLKGFINFFDIDIPKIKLNTVLDINLTEVESHTREEAKEKVDEKCPLCKGTGKIVSKDGKD